VSRLKPSDLPAVEYIEQDEPCDYHEHPVAAKLWARDAWWKGKYTLAEIAEAINVSERIIGVWIKGTQRFRGWSKEKELYDRKHLTKSIGRNSVRMESLITKMLSILERSAHNLIDNRHSLSVAEFNQFLNGFEKLFKTKQLERGQPTDIFAEGASAPTWSEVVDRMKSVDILDYSELERKTVEIVGRESEKVNSGS